MKINVQATNFNVDQKLVDFTQRKVDKLYKFYDKILTVDVFLRWKMLQIVSINLLNLK